MNQFKSWLQKFMIGRYGVDQLSLSLLGLGLLIWVITLPFNYIIVRLLCLIPIGLCYFRTLSRNTYKRQQENFKFKKRRIKFFI